MTDVYECSAKVISPVHIGSGNNYGASEYVPGKVKLNGEVTEIFKKIDVSRYYLSLDDDRKDYFLSSLSDPNFSLYGFDKKVPNEYREYLAINMCKENPSPKHEIAESIKTLNESYIPGTSLKGAIRTALVYDSINFEDVPDIIDNLIPNSNGGTYINRRDYEKKYKNFINNIFSSDNKRAPQTSIMKFLQISDSNTVKIPAVYDVFTVMASERGGRKTNQLFHNGVKSFLEVIRRGQKLKFKINNNFDKSNYGSLKLNGRENLIELDNMKSAIYSFSKEYIKHEIMFAEEYGISYLSKFYKQIEKLNKPSKPLIKIGAGSGFLATTIGLKVLEYDDYNFDDYMNKIADLTRGKTYDFCFPKSRKVTSKGGFPLGWVQLSFEEYGE